LKFKNIYLHGTNGLLGLNTTTPNANLDIKCTNDESINVATTSRFNRNILSRTNQNHGITLFSDDISGSYIQFYNDTPIIESQNDISFVGNPQYYNADAQIKYLKGGILEINTVTDTHISSNLIVSDHRSVNKHLLNETAIIYDNIETVLCFDDYQNPNAKSGNALTLVSADSSSSTFLNIITPNV
jgi:hypothetical protein